LSGPRATSIHLHSPRQRRPTPPLAAAAPLDEIGNRTGDAATYAARRSRDL